MPLDRSAPLEVPDVRRAAGPSLGSSCTRPSRDRPRTAQRPAVVPRGAARLRRVARVQTRSRTDRGPGARITTSPPTVRAGQGACVAGPGFEPG